jgi:ornithine cyclodeaminase
MAALFDNGYLTDVRTALAGAVAAKHLAREESSVVAVIGAGVQARLQLEALTLVRSIAAARVWARDPAKAGVFAGHAGEDLGFPVTVSDSVERAAHDADIVVTATPSTVPLLDETMLSPGAHVTAVGSDAEHKQELAVSLVAAADPFVCDSISQSGRLGELRAAAAAGIDAGAVELGSVVIGDAGRGAADSITVCDLTGTGAQDTAIAGLAVARSRQADLGATVDT